MKTYSRKNRQNHGTKPWENPKSRLKSKKSTRQKGKRPLGEKVPGTEELTLEQLHALTKWAEKNRESMGCCFGKHVLVRVVY